MKASRAIIKCLENEGVKVVFGYPGATICPVYNELTTSNIKHILVRQEQNAGHAANGYARISGMPGVCFATSGPGATNLLTAIATAYMDSVALVIVTGQVPSSEIGKDVFQEADITGSAEPFVKHSFLVKDANELPKIIKEAFYIAGTGRNGPVLIDIPQDIQETDIDYYFPETVSIRSYKPSNKGNKLQIKKICDAIKNSSFPVICSGGGIFSSGATNEIRTLTEKLSIPVVTTMMGLISLPSSHPLNFGMIGMYGNKTANYAVSKCDLFILIGARVGDRAVKSKEFLSDSAKIVHIDIDPAEIGKNISVDIPVVGDAKTIINQILSSCEEMKHDNWISYLQKYRSENSEEKLYEKFVNPREIIRVLSEKLPADSICVGDVGQNLIFTSDYLKMETGRLLTSGGMGTMGYSLPAAIGAKFASPSSEVIAICGDGAFHMNMCELATIKQFSIPVKIILFKNNTLGLVYELQKNLYNSNFTATDIKDGNPDFCKLAEAYNIPALEITNNTEIKSAIQNLLNAESTFLLVCNISSEEKSI